MGSSWQADVSDLIYQGPVRGASRIIGYQANSPHGSSRTPLLPASLQGLVGTLPSYSELLCASPNYKWLLFSFWGGVCMLPPPLFGC